MDKCLKGATKRFTRRLILAFIIALLIIAGAITIAYCKGSDRGAELYQQSMQQALIDAYNQGYTDGESAMLPTIDSGELSGFALCGDTFSVFITIDGKSYEYKCEAGDVTRALPFQTGN